MDSIRDYATAAFRHYAVCGRKTAEEIQREIYEKAQEAYQREACMTKSPSSPVEGSILTGEKAIENRKAEILDILAVDDTLKLIDDNTRTAIEIVYFVNADKPLKKGDISARVTIAAQTIHAGEATIYRWLSRARRIFALERCLRINPKR